MKKIGAIFCMVMITVMMFASSATAAGFDIAETSPKNDATGVPLENMGVKVYFNEAVYSKENQEENAKACKLVDSKGKEIESRVIFNPKDKDVVLVLAKKETSKGKKITIEPTTDYKLVIDKDFTSADGDKLGETKEIKFETLNPSTSTKISMVMMLVMVGGMVFASSRAMKKQENENKPQKKEEKFNPYKVAKETGKSVEEVIAAEKKRREKEEAKAARKAKHHTQDDDEEVEEYMEPGHFKVKGVRTVAEGGSSYITGRKAEAEKKAAIEAKIKADKAKGKNKKNNHKKKKR